MSGVKPIFRALMFLHCFTRATQSSSENWNPGSSTSFTLLDMKYFMIDETGGVGFVFLPGTRYRRKLGCTCLSLISENSICLSFWESFLNLRLYLSKLLHTTAVHINLRAGTYFVLPFWTCILCFLLTPVRIMQSSSSCTLKVVSSGGRHGGAFPPPRQGHASVFSNGMLVVFGGRTNGKGGNRRWVPF